MKLPEENTRKMIEDDGMGKVFLDKAPKLKAAKAKRG
jgi:hypothetical protein